MLVVEATSKICDQSLELCARKTLRTEDPLTDVADRVGLAL